MNEPNDFLARWSRRKLKGDDEHDIAARTPASGTPATPANEPPVSKEQENEIDLAALPPIDSITSATDVSVFLRKGVPAELTREALRRAWVADPAIRDFVGLAENSGDFTNNSMPGFGPLDLSQDRVREMLANLFESKRLERPQEEAQQASTEEVGSDTAAAQPPKNDTPDEPLEQSVAQGAVPLEQPSADDAPQHEAEPASESPTRRLHGSALPR